MKSVRSVEHLSPIKSQKSLKSLRDDSSRNKDIMQALESDKIKSVKVSP